MGNLDRETIKAIYYGPVQKGPRGGQYRKYRLEGTEWNTDLVKLCDIPKAASDACAKEGRKCEKCEIFCPHAKMKRKITDQRGLYLFLSNAGSILWRIDYSYHGKRKTLSIGIFPEITLLKAREELVRVRRQLAEGIDPSEVRKKEKAASRKERKEGQEEVDTFEKVAREWHTLKMTGKQSGPQVLSVFERDVFPYIGDKAIADVTRDDVLAVLRKIEARGALARVACQLINRVLEYSLILGKVRYNAASGLVAVLQSRPTKHFSYIRDAAMLGRYLRDMETKAAIKSFSPEIRQFLRILPHVFTRPNELAAAKWAEIDFDKGLWTIPAERMKKRRPHIVPLSRQVTEMFRELLPFTGEREFVFYSPRSKTGYITNRSLTIRLRGFEGECDYGKESFTLHGFRSTASTLLHEQAYRTEVIETQLAHVDQNSTRAAYNHAEFLEDRRAMMQSWSDCLDKLKEGKS